MLYVVEAKCSVATLFATGDKELVTDDANKAKKFSTRADLYCWIDENRASFPEEFTLSDALYAKSEPIIA